jgi:hypothetical protein
VLSRAQYATLETLVDAIIPADERSPGAKAAKVADYIDLLLQESDARCARRGSTGWPLSMRQPSRGSSGRSRSSRGRRRHAAEDDERERAGSADAILERFFVVTKTPTIQGYYTSEIGIHQELRYLGNQPTLEFVGCHTVDGKDCPHCGQKAS